MTDDLFEDFDLKTSADTAKKEAVGKRTEKISSQEMHPDIFPGASAEKEAETEMSEDEIRCLMEKIDEMDDVPVKTAAAEPEIVFADTTVKAVEPVSVEPEVEVRTIDKVRRPDVVLDPENFGMTLRRLRESACLTIRDLSGELRIKESFLIALENEDYDSLPPEVYVVAYIRRLGAIYHLTEEEIVSLSGKVRERMEVELPEDMDKVVAIYEPSEENESKLRHIYMAFSAILVIALILIAVGIYFFVSVKKTDKGSVPEIKHTEHFSSDMLIQLQPEVKLESPALKINR